MLDDQFDNVNISHFIMSANVIDLAFFSIADDQIDRSTVVFNIEPVSDIDSFPIDRKWLII